MDDTFRAELLAYCLAKPGAWQDEPLEGDVVTKVGSKICAFPGGTPRLPHGPHPGRWSTAGVARSGGHRVTA